MAQISEKSILQIKNYSYDQTRKMIIILGSNKGEKNHNSPIQLTCLYNSLLMIIADTTEKEQKFLLLPVYVLCPIHSDPSLYLNDPDEKYAEFISTTSLS